MKFYAWLLLTSWLLSTGIASAEGGCPAGMIPHSGTDINSCGPIPPGYYKNQLSTQLAPQVPAVLWASKWGAIATDFAHSSAGASVNESTRDSAEQAALMQCKSNGGSACKIEVSYSNGCGVMVVSDKIHNSNYGGTIEEATQKGMKMCRDAGETQCRVYYSACSLPQPIP